MKVKTTVLIMDGEPEKDRIIIRFTDPDGQQSVTYLTKTHLSNLGYVAGFLDRFAKHFGAEVEI